MCTMLSEFNGYCMHIYGDVLSPSALCAGQPNNPIISRTQNGPALTDPVVFGVNQTVSVWCKAENTPKKLLAFFWRYPNGSRVPKVGGEDGVYRERIGDDNAPVWWAVLHFSRIQPSVAGNYTCEANDDRESSNLLNTLEVQVSGELIVYM